MEDLATVIGKNPYLQALAGLVALATAVIFLWNNRTLLIALVLFLPRKLNQLISPTDQQRTLAIAGGSLNPSYLIACVSRHFAVAFMAIIIWVIGVRVAVLLNQVEPATTATRLVYWSFVILNNVLGAIVTARLLEIHTVARRVMQLIESTEFKNAVDSSIDLAS